MRRRPLLIFLATLAILGAGASIAHADVCDDVPSVGLGPVSTGTACNVAVHPLRSAKDLAGAVTHPGDTAKDIVAAPFKAAGDEIMQGVTTWVANGAGWLVEQGGKLIDETTTPRLESAWFLRQYGLMTTIAALFALPLLLLAIVQGILHRDGGAIVRAAALQLPLAFIFTAMAVVVVTLCLAVTDLMSAQVAVSVGSDARAFFADTTKALATLGGAAGGVQGAVGAPLFATFLGALVAAIGAFLVWLELLLRSAAIYVTVLFLPLGFVSMIWPTTARWTRALGGLLFAIIFCKFVIVAILALAAAGMGQSRSEDAFQGVLAGGALLILAALSPFTLLKLVPIVEAAMDRFGGRRAAGMAAMPMSPSMMMSQVVASNWGAGRVATAGAAAAGGGGGGALVAAGAAGGGGSRGGGGSSGPRPSSAGGGESSSRGRSQAGGGSGGAGGAQETTSGAAARTGTTRPGGAGGEGTWTASAGEAVRSPAPAGPAHAGPAHEPPREPAGSDGTRDRHRNGGEGNAR
jgi:type IV secretion system protein TrbL